MLCLATPGNQPFPTGDATADPFAIYGHRLATPIVLKTSLWWAVAELGSRIITGWEPLQDTSA